MTSRILAGLVALFALAVLIGASPSVPAAPDVPADNNDIAVQARGPVHEGYAQPFDAAPQSGPVAPKAPPDPIPELPPDQKPEGDNVQWVPGYWNWDDEKSDYLWVSGFWRAAPPERKWVAGYWRKADDGWQWVSGYWGPENQERAPLLEPPPQPLEAGPTVPAPDDGSLYVPGAWVWRSERYLWRPGYWRSPRLGWVWEPAHYVWTPGGCVFVDGYWDYPLETRGVLFAPVVFERPLWRNPGWCFRPSFVVSIDTPFFSALFVRPSCGRYYFGDYYGASYVRAGYQPWCQYGPRHHDPLYGYARWSHRTDPSWVRGVNAVYAGRRDGNLARPGRTLAEQTTVVRRASPAAAPGLTVVQPINNFHGGLKLAGIDRAQVERHQAAAQRVQEATRQRVQVERPGERSRSVVNPSPVRNPVPGRPEIVNQPADRAAGRHHDSRPPAPIIEHPAPTKPAVPAPAVVTKPAAPTITKPAPRTERGVGPPAPVIEHPAPGKPVPPAPSVVTKPAAPAVINQAPRTERRVSPPAPVMQPSPALAKPSPPAPAVITKPPVPAIANPAPRTERRISPPAPSHAPPAPARVSPAPARKAPPPPARAAGGQGGQRDNSRKKK